MKIGDKVRFLSDTGGGTVAGFQGKAIVLVEDEDGFQIPTQISDVVVIESDNYDSQPKKTPQGKADVLPKPYGKGTLGAQQIERQETKDTEPADKPVTFKAKPVERRGGEMLSAYLAFVPKNIRELSITEFDTYLVNDCNYHLFIAYQSQEDGACALRFQGVVEPNTKIKVETFSLKDLNRLERVNVQAVAFKEAKNYLLKPVVDAQIRVDVVKFYKLHTFQENDFFETPALIYTIVENDKVVRPLVIDERTLKREMLQKKHFIEPAKPNDQRTAARKTDKHAPVVVDLHAKELLDTFQGMQAKEILDYQLDVFRRTMAQYLARHGTQIVFIHGKGNGVLRKAICSELQRKYKETTFQDASFQEYGYGATLVKIR